MAAIRTEFPDDDAGVRELRADRGHGVDAAHVRKAEVHERDVGPVLAEPLQPLLRGAGLGDQLHVALALDHRGDSLPQEGMVVDTEDADGGRSAHTLSPVCWAITVESLKATAPGTDSSISVPAPVWLRTRRRAPMWAARLRMPGSPHSSSRAESSTGGAIPQP